MSSSITWDFIRDNLFPTVVYESQRAGLDVTGWDVELRGSSMAWLVRGEPNPETGERQATVLHRFGTPTEAQEYLQGARMMAARVADARPPESDFYAISARVLRDTDDGWSGARELPTFYLNRNVQGILSAESAQRVAERVVNGEGLFASEGTEFKIHAVRV